MRQVFQNLRSGVTSLEDVPSPRPGAREVLIRNRTSLISAGTERGLVEFGRSSLVGKVKSQPDKVKQVLDKIRADGLLPTLDAVFKRLDEPLPLGYSSTGDVIAVGSGVAGIQPGQRVASNGPHAEIVCVPEHLCARVPDGVTDEQAAFTVLGSIGLQGVRLSSPTLGERFVVYGLGLIGLVTAQILRAQGCHVLGIDLSPARLAVAGDLGVETLLAGKGAISNAVLGWTGGQGADGVIITASADTDAIVRDAAEMSRKRGRIVLVGVVGLHLRRTDFYEKELTFQVSCSYGPGRYDERYEQMGQDYPPAFVRWTEQRNFEAVLDLMRLGSVRVDPLITDRYAIQDAPTAYTKLTTPGEDALGILLTYSADAKPERSVRLRPRMIPGAGRATVGVIGAGNFAKMTLLPALARTRAALRYVCDLNGAAARHAAKSFGGETATTDYRDLLDDPGVDAVLIAVGHHLHAALAVEALAAEKHVFVEKPLATELEGMRRVEAAVLEHPDRQFLVGFNRRFSPFATKVKGIIDARGEPLTMNVTVNAGGIAPGHWVHDPARGGGRIIGEACHFIDLMVFLTGSRVEHVAAFMVGPGPAIREDKMAISVAMADGSVGTVNYFANGAKTYPKEVIEVFSDGRVLRIDNFRKLQGFGVTQQHRTLMQEKGHREEIARFVDAVARGGSPVIPLDELVNVTLATFAAGLAARERRVVTVAELIQANRG